MPVDRARNSRSHEQMIEHAFLSDLMQEIWFSRGEVVEVSKAEVDAWGYDVVLSVGDITRHAQLKSPKNGSKLDVHALLGKKPSGCVVWVIAQEEANRLKFTYRYFGGKPGAALPDVTRFPLALHDRYASDGTRHKRVAKYRVPPTEFTRPGTTAELANRLFGPGRGTHGAASRRRKPVE